MAFRSAAGAFDAEFPGRGSAGGGGVRFGRGQGPRRRPGSAPPPPRPQHEFAAPLARRTLDTLRCYSVGGGWERRSAQPPPTTRASVKSVETTRASVKSVETTRASVKSVETARASVKSVGTARASVKSVETARASVKSVERVSRSSSTFKKPSLVRERADGSYCEWFAAALGNLEWLRFCLNPDLKGILTDNKGFTAIHFAAQKGKLECLQVLVEEYQFPVDLPTKNGQTPLHLVIHKENRNVVLPCIRYLLQHGAALNTQTRNGSTPLHLAAREGLLSCVKVLVKNGANVHARDAIGCKPIDYCKIWNHRVCARFLKDAMWKRDKKDFACEMGKLKRLKGQLALMEQDYQTEYQKELQVLRQADFKKWLHRKLLPRGQSLTPSTEQEPQAPPWAIPVSKIPKLPKSFHPSPEEHLQQIPQPHLQPPLTATPLYRQPTVRQPKPWNISNNPARSPTAQIGSPPGIRLGVHPDPSLEHDFRRFLKIRSDGQGGAQLRTVAGNQVAPVPRLPLEVIVRELYPQVRPCRMKVPQGFHSVSIRDVDRKRYLGDNTFWTDTLAMNLRETFDETFLAAVQAHQGLPVLPCP
ncbi:ankyrin repeat domain-containing protein 53 [Eptesicus fuscus]|uniref:ankyrin repeat domain-containing protein 53 n=1 Tax=Eptesicus fuscus TaxID=29078 RepID=UPI0024046AEF|nr:ankyrin repeat domain-containing protein 53 [Eptesicus fuscus]